MITMMDERRWRFLHLFFVWTRMNFFQIIVDLGRSALTDRLRTDFLRFRSTPIVVPSFPERPSCGERSRTLEVSKPCTEMLDIPGIDVLISSLVAISCNSVDCACTLASSNFVLKCMQIKKNHKHVFWYYFQSGLVKKWRQTINLKVI